MAVPAKSTAWFSLLTPAMLHTIALPCFASLAHLARLVAWLPRLSCRGVERSRIVFWPAAPRGGTLPSGLLAPREHLVARGRPLPPGDASPTCTFSTCTAPSLGIHPQADQPVHSDAKAPLAAPDPASPVLSWFGMARVVLLRVCPTLYPLQTLFNSACCVQHSAHLRLSFLGSFPLYAISACLTQVPYGTCCLPLRA
jgi:hypothetical protein